MGHATTMWQSLFSKLSLFLLHHTVCFLQYELSPLIIPNGPKLLLLAPSLGLSASHIGTAQFTLSHQHWLWNGSPSPSQKLTLSWLHPKSGLLSVRGHANFFPEKWTQWTWVCHHTHKVLLIPAMESWRSGPVNRNICSLYLFLRLKVMSSHLTTFAPDIIQVETLQTVPWGPLLPAWR